MSIGFAFGIVGVASHLSILEICLLSLCVYAGAAQFIICSLLVSGSPISAIILTTFIVNLRHLLLSLTIAPYFTKYSLAKNIGFGALLTDESFGVAVNKAAQNGRLYDKWMNGLNITAYMCWVISCVMGGLLGQWISDPYALGLDFALPAMFAASLVSAIAIVRFGKAEAQPLLNSLYDHFYGLVIVFRPVTHRGHRLNRDCGNDQGGDGQMSISTQMIWIILGRMIVTLVPRIVPFIFVRNIQMPELALKWLSFIPLCILTALVTESMIVKTNSALTFDWKAMIVLIPTLLCAMRTKSLSITVITGVVLMAAVRLIW